MSRGIVVISFLLLALTACRGEAAVDSTAAADRVEAATTTLAAAEEIEVGAGSTPRDESVVPDYSVLIATVESAMEGTSYEGAALEDPEVFIATAELFCDLLDEGMTQEQLLAEYLDRLGDGGETVVDEDDGLMAGVLLGASIEIVCPAAGIDP